MVFLTLGAPFAMGLFLVLMERLEALFLPARPLTTAERAEAAAWRPPAPDPSAGEAPRPVDDEVGLGPPVRLPTPRTPLRDAGPAPAGRDARREPEPRSSP